MKIPRQLLTPSLPIRFAAQSLSPPASAASNAGRSQAAGPAVEALRSWRRATPAEPVKRRTSLAEHFLPVEQVQAPPAAAKSITKFPDARQAGSSSPVTAGFASRVVPHTWRWPICPRLTMHAPQTDTKWVVDVNELKLKDFSIGEMRLWVADFDSLARSDAAFSAAEFNHYYAYLTDGNVADPAQRDNYLSLRKAFCDAIVAGPTGRSLAAAHANPDAVR